jgi:epoxyqueuosine reductase QueG
MMLNNDSTELAKFITGTVQHEVAEASNITDYREPLVAFVEADDPRFADLRRVAQPTHMMPDDLLPGARSVISFFLPFDYWVVEANAQDREEVAREWAEAYVETNHLIERITKHLIESLADQGIRAAAEPPTHNFDPISLVSRAGRFGSVVIDADLPISAAKPKERCLYFHDGSCLECILRCPVDALDENDPIDRQRCYRRLRSVAKRYEHLDLVEVCGKCAIGPCPFESAVQ